MPLRLMCLTAHPDDECGAFGGLLLHAAHSGHATAVLCLTEGAAGSYREPGQSNTELAAVRRVEFHNACRALQVRDARLLSYADGALWQESFPELVRVLTAALRRFRPHVVLTFGGEGGVNQHRDHTVVSLAGTAAFHAAGLPGYFPDHSKEQLSELEPWAPQKLYYAATPFIATSDPEKERVATRTPASFRFPLGELEKQKWAAFAKHRSQVGLLEKVRDHFGHEMSHEGYLLVAARTPQPEEQDIWAGVLDE